MAVSSFSTPAQVFLNEKRGYFSNMNNICPMKIGYITKVNYKTSYFWSE